MSRQPPSDSPSRLIAIGSAIIFLFFGVFGGWASIAPLNSAVVANAVVKVDGNRKSVDHLDGGVVKAIAVREGDHVNQGDTLVVLDDTTLRATVDGFDQQRILLLAIDARLGAERDSRSDILFPAELTARITEKSVAAAIAGQELEFNNRRADVAGQKVVIQQRIAQLQQAIAGSIALAETDQEQLDSVTAQRASLNGLFQKGLVANDQILELDRTGSGIRGQIGQADSDIARAHAGIDEDNAQIAQLDKDRASDVSNTLRDTESKLVDVSAQLTTAQDALQRAIIRAPYAGTVVGMTVFSVGGVVARGQRILDIVPDGTPLTVEAQIAVGDIADVKPGLVAEVHLTAYDQRLQPIIHGKVTSVSADRLTDDRTGLAYYSASVEIDPADLAATSDVKLYPGMPATVMIPTGARTALAYLVGPLAATFDSAFRQR